MANGATQNFCCPANARKKSYIKACRTAAKEGVAKYRGIYLGPKELGMKEVSSEVEEVEEPATQNTASHGRILRNPKMKFEMGILSWNAGGLTSRYLDEIIALLETQEYRRVRLVSLQETHWSTKSMYSKGNWHIVTSSVPEGRKAGVMTMVHKSLCTLSDIRAIELVQGRLQQVRLPWQNSHIHVITGYQHVWQSQLTKNENIEQRKTWTTRLQGLLNQIPQRDKLIVCADFNTTAMREPPFIGPCSLHRNSKARQYLKPINAVCREFNLTAINTFACRKPHTFQNGKTKSQIDFILVRQKDAGQKAKQAKPEHSFPVGANRQGPKHSPIVAMLHVPPYRKARVHKANFNLASLEEGFRKKDPTWHEFSQALSAAVQTANEGDWQTLELAMLNEVERFYPRQQRIPSRAMDIGPEYWNKHKTLRRLKAQGQEALAAYNSLREEIDSEIKQYKKVQQDRRREKQEKILFEANMDKQQQSHKISKALRSLAPWKPPDKISLRDPQGRLLSEEAEAKMMQDYSTATFCKSGGLLPVENPHPVAATAEMVMEHANSIPLGKAVPRQAAPVAAWRSMDNNAAQTIARKLAEDTGRANLDTHLKDPFVSWLPKPGKVPNRPANLRPIGVLSVPAKILAGIVREEVSSTIQQKAQNAPQFAYLKKRGTREAILHAVKHLEEASSLAEIGKRRRRLHEQGNQTLQVLGSVIVSLDLSKAFDSVNRTQLMQALEDLGVEAHTRQLVQQLHTNTTYRMTISGISVAVSVTSGIKQGCKLAPILWTALTLALLDQLSANQGLAENEISRLITLFADDFLVKGHFRNERELQDILGHLEELFALLQSVGLVTNPGKSQALLQLHGTKAQVIREAYVHKGKDGRELSISQAIKIPIKKSIVYLGVVLAFGNYKDLTVRHRLIQAREKFRQIRKTLRGTRVLSVAQRLSIWQSQVVSSMLYGLESVGLTDYGLRLIRQRFSANIRYIMGDHQIHRQNTAHQIIDSLQVADPKKQVLDRMGGFLLSLEDSSVESTQPMRDELQHFLQDKFVQASELAEGWEETEPKEDKLLHTCRQCGGIFQTWAGLVRHHKARHGDIGKLRNGPKFNIRLDSQQGTACCRGCKRQLASMIQLRTHVESGACPNVEVLFDARKTSPAENSVPAHLTEIYDLRKQGLDAILASHTCKVAIKKYCVLCGQHIIGHKGFKQHIKQVHGTTWDKHSAEVLTSMQSHKIMLSKGSACRYCTLPVDAPGRHATQCIVLLQAYFVIIADYQQVEDSRKERHRHEQPGVGNRRRSVALRTSFANPHQLCYANSVWGLLLHCQSQTVSALNSFQRVWRAFRSSSDQHIDLSTLPVVRRISETWRLQAIQEDAGHYLQHVLQCEGVTLMEWEARAELSFPAETLVEDRGSNIVMLNTVDQGESMEVQALLDSWKVQPRVQGQGTAWHGLTQCNELLLIQIPRYVRDSKDRRPCRIPMEVQAPVFTGLDTQIIAQRFSLIGGLLHIGEEPRSGHYRQFIIEDGIACLGDDFQRPQPTQISTPLMETNVYILVFLRDSSPDVAGSNAPSEEPDGGGQARRQAATR